MLSRRSFLKALCSVPAIAALPAVAQVVNALPMVDEPALPTAGPACGLRVAGRTLACRSLSMTTIPQYIDVTKLGDVGREWFVGAHEIELTASVYMDDSIVDLQDAYMSSEPVEFAVDLGEAHPMIVAKGTVDRISLNASPDEPITADIHIRGLDVVIGGQPSAYAYAIKANRHSAIAPMA